MTVPIASSDGENIVLAIRSQNIQNTEPHKNIAGIVTIGFVVLSDNLVICGKLRNIWNRYMYRQRI